MDQPIKHHPYRGSRRLFLNSSSVSSIIPIEEVEDSSPMDPSTLKQSLVQKQKILPQSILNKEEKDSSLVSPIHQTKILSEEAKDSSLVDHTSTLLLNESIHTTPQ